MRISQSLSGSSEGGERAVLDDPEREVNKHVNKYVNKHYLQEK